MDLADPDARAGAGGLGERREAELLDPRAYADRVLLELASGHDDAGRDRETGGLQDDLHVGLVHADRGGEHAGADVAHAGHLEHPLQGAVLAPRAVEQREDHVDLADDRRDLGGSVTTRSVAGGAPSSATSDASGVDLGQVVAADREPGGVVGLQHPPAVGGDADRHDVVRLAVDRGQHAPGGHARDAVLGGPAAEDDRDARLAARAAGSGPRGGCGLVRGGVVHCLTLSAYAGRMAADLTAQARHHRRHGRPAGTRAGRPAQHADHHGVHLRRRRRPGVRPLRQPHLDGAGGRARRPRGRPVPDLRLRAGGRRRPCSTWSATEGKVVAPQARLHRHDHAAGRPRGARSDHAPSWSTSPTPTPSSRPATTPRWCGWSRPPTPPSRSPTSRRSRPPRTRPVPTSSSTTPSPLPCCRRPLEDDVDIVVHSATKYLAGHSDVLLGAICHPRRRALRRAQGPSGPARRHPRSLRGVADPARPAHPAPARRARPGQRAGARTPPRRAPGAVRGALPRASARSSAIVLAQGEMAADLLTRKTRLWVHATSLGGVESTLERRRRWKAEAADHPRGARPALRRHRGRRGPLGRPARRPRRLRRLTPSRRSDAYGSAPSEVPLARADQDGRLDHDRVGRAADSAASLSAARPWCRGR